MSDEQSRRSDCSLEQYLRNGIQFAGVIDYCIRASIDEEGRVTFYIRPDGADGDTRDFQVSGNELQKAPYIVDSP